MTENKTPKAEIAPRQLTGDSRFTFECKKDLPCFTSCCRGIDIVLTPYDVLRLKKRLDLPSDQFLAIYTNVQLLEKTDLPVPVLKMLDEDDAPCPFVREDGCLIYTDRPASCRYYPVGQGTLRPKEAGETEAFYFMVKEPHCTGFECPTNWTIDEWRADQGVDEYDKMNAGWTELVVRKRSFPHTLKITDKAKQMFFMASYDLDRFRRFVFESSFLTLYDVDDQTLAEIKEDDVALLKFGYTWLNGVLFKRGPLAVTEEAAKMRMEGRENPES